MATQDNAMIRRPQDQPEHVSTETRVAPPVDVYENDDEVLLLADVPGVEKEGLDIRLDAAQLALTARPSIHPSDDGHRAIIYERTFTLPQTIDAAKVTAELDAGVLRIRLPKSETARPRRIAVKSG